MRQKYFASATIRAQENDEGNPEIYGRAVEYGRVGYFGWGFRLVVAPGAEAEKLKERTNSAERDILALIAHDSARVLGRTNRGTLSFDADADGVNYSIDINREDTEAMSAYAKVWRGEYDAASIGFYIIDSHEEVVSDNSIDADMPDVDVSVDMADEIDIVEISVLAHGAFGGATSLAANAHYQIQPSASIEGTTTLVSTREVRIEGTPFALPADGDYQLTKVGDSWSLIAGDDFIDSITGVTVTKATEDQPPVDEVEAEEVEDEPEVEAEEVEDEPEVEAEEVETVDDDSASEDITDDVVDEGKVPVDDTEDSASESDTDEGESADSGEAVDGDDPTPGSAGKTINITQAKSQAMSLGLINLLQDTEEDNA